jgi:cardiolipin synthase A/B
VSWFIPHLEIVFGGTLALIAVLLLVQQRRSPQSTAAWLLLIFLVPYLALPLFLAFGIRKSNRVPRLRFSRPAADWPVQADADRVYRALGMPAATPGNAIEFFMNGGAAYDGLKRLIESARHSIDAQFYIVQDDAVGSAFVRLLEAKAREGVRVRLQIDRFGGLSRPRKDLRALKHAGGQVSFASRFIGMPGSGRLNCRNHRKTLIVDGRRAFGGGMNVGCDYMSLGADTPEADWTDLSFVIEGPAVQAYMDIIVSDLKTAPDATDFRQTDAAAQPAGSAILQPVPSGPDIKGDILHDGLVCEIHRAKRRIWIVTPYFLPTDQLGHALMVACARGVDVRLLIPDVSNQKLADLARGTYLRNFREAGGRIIRNQRMIHTKTGIIDDLAWAGSANFDVRSMYINFETALMIYDPQSVGVLEAWVSEQFALGSDGLIEIGFGRRLAEGAFRLAAPVL